MALRVRISDGVFLDIEKRPFTGERLIGVPVKEYFVLRMPDVVFACNEGVLTETNAAQIAAHVFAQVTESLKDIALNAELLREAKGEVKNGVQVIPGSGDAASSRPSETENSEPVKEGESNG